MASLQSFTRPAPDDLLAQIADYVGNFNSPSNEALATARYCLLDTLGCGLLALKYPACTKLLGPVVPGTVVPNGARVPGTNYVLDPVTAAFNIGTLVRWLDFNDTWLAAEWGHPSDNLGAILAVADYLSQNGSSITMRDVLTAIRIPAAGDNTRAGFNEFARRHGDYAMVGLAANAEADGDGFSDVRLAYFGVGATPVRARQAETALTNGDIESAVKALGHDLDPPSDVHSTSATKRHLAGVLLRKIAKQLGTQP